MKRVVTKTETRMIVLQLKEPFRFVYGTFSEIPRVLIRIEIESEAATHVGWGEAAIDFPFVPYDMFDVYDALCEAGRRVAGINVDTVSHVLENEALVFLRDVPAAQCALNMALDDVVSRSEGLSASNLYEVQRGAGVPLCSVGFDHRHTPEVWATLPGVVKVKAGQGLDLDLANIQSVQKVANQTRKQYALDCNAAYSLEEVLSLIDRLRAGGWAAESCIAWEQPLHAEASLDDWGRLIAEFKTFAFGPVVIADESFVSAAAGQQLVDRGAGLNYKIQKLGGIHAAVQLEKTISRSGFKSFVGGTFPSPLGRAYDTLAGQVITSATLPGDGFLPASTYLNEACIAAFPVRKDGLGLGVEPDEGALARWTIDDPREEFYRIRTGQTPKQIKLAVNAPYAELYLEQSGRQPLWNMTARD